MTTQLATPERSFSLNMPTGHGLSKLVEIPSNKIDRGLIFARPEAIPAAQNYLSAADHLLEEKRWNSGRVFVTSPVPGDGKTCTAFNLAWALSCRNKSVLLVELNFARPQFRSLLGNLRVWHGIDCALRGAAKPGDSMFSIGPPGLNVCAVRDATSPHHRNQHFERLDAFLDWCGERYNWLILDCPPVLSREWSPWYREYASPALLVVRQERTPLVQVRKAAKLLGGKLQGVLLNDSVKPLKTPIQAAKQLENGMNTRK